MSETPTPAQVHMRAVLAKRYEQPTKSILVSTSRDATKRKVQIDRFTFNMPFDGVVEPHIDPDGSGYVTLRLPAARVQVIDADMRVIPRHSSRKTREEKGAEK